MSVYFLVWSMICSLVVGNLTPFWCNYQFFIEDSSLVAWNLLLWNTLMCLSWHLNNCNTALCSSYAKEYAFISTVKREENMTVWWSQCVTNYFLHLSSKRTEEGRSSQVNTLNLAQNIVYASRVCIEHSMLAPVCKITMTNVMVFM